MIRESAFDERSTGGIVYRVENGRVLWLVIKTVNRDRNGEEVHKFPKGHLRKDEFLKQAAIREVEEEGRVKAKIVEKIGSNDYIIWDKFRKKKIVKKVTFFLMEYEGESRLKYNDAEVVLDRLWLDIGGAKEKLAYESEKKLLEKAMAKVETLLKSQKTVK